MVAVNDPRGLAPQGWHVSTMSELNSLVAFLGGIDTAGGRMKGGSWGQTYSCMTNIFDNTILYSNISGFKALPGGKVNNTGQTECDFYCYTPGGGACYFNTGSFGYWWSATSANSANANSIQLIISNESVTSAESDKKFGYSVRCVKN